MSKFTDTVKQDTPRLVVMFRRDGTNEQFQWGVSGSIPLLSLVGAIVRVQAELGSYGNEECPESALVITWDDTTKWFNWFIHPDIPLHSMCGMLETIKLTIISSKMGQQVAAQQVQVLGPDGQPMRR